MSHNSHLDSFKVFNLDTFKRNLLLIFKYFTFFQFISILIVILMSVKDSIPIECEGYKFEYLITD